MNALHGISCVRYWSLILQYFYNKEGILVPNDEEKVDFQTYNYPKDVTDNAEEFPFVARIPDAMLERVDPKNPVLVPYLKNIDTNVETGKLLPREEKKSKRSFTILITHYSCFD